MSPTRLRSLVMRTILLAVTNVFFAVHISALADTDTITWGGDNTRAGYQDNHNMDPNVVAGSDFGQIFKTLLPGNFNNLGPEQIFSQPLVYTGNDGVQYVYIATTQNNIYKLNAKTGAIVASRNLHVPFLQVELESCVDINPMIGVTATGVIDPTTGIWYLTAKTYADRFQDGNFSPTNPPGRLNGRYWQHAIHTEDLSEATNWPVLIDGTVFRNNPNRMFIGGNQHSRPGALLVGDYVYTAYASHCVQYNFTGAIIGFHKTTGKIIEAFATQGGPEPNTVKGGGIWMSGGGLAYDGKGSMYFATGNGYASQLKATGNSVPGRSPPTSLEEAAVNAKINDDGTLTIIDFFMPWEKTQLDGGDRDLGTTPLEILPSDVFSCPNHRRIGVVTGKTGKTYWLNLDNLGGYQNGPNNLDAVIQTFQNENSVYAGAGVLPLSGGYIYIPVTQYQTHVFKFSCNSASNAVFTRAGDTPDKNAFILGTGHGTTTSLNGQEGTGLLWISDVQGTELRIYDPIPPNGGGPLTLLNSFQLDAVTKFTRPVFGDGTVYIGTTKGYLYGFGSPNKASLNCTVPAFGNLAISSGSATVTIICTAQVNINSVNNITLNSTNFRLAKPPTVPFALSTGQSFSMNATFAPVNVGSQSDDIVISTTNAQAGFSSTIRVTLRGTGQSPSPLLAIAPNTIQFSVIAGNPSDQQTTLFWNLGNNLLTFTNISFSQVSNSGPWISPTTTTNGNLQVGNFVFISLPKTIPAGSSVSVSVIYSPSVPGNDTVYLRGFSDGGTAALNVYGSAGTNPKAVIEFQTIDGSGWVPYSSTSPFSFGTVYEATGRILKMRVTNGGGPNAVPLSITVSKPPYGIPGIIGKSNNIDLAEGTIISATQSQSADMFCSVPKSQVNVPSYNGSTSWTLNTNDPTLGKLDIQFFCNAAAEQLGPLLSNGSASWPYVGCFKENNPGRQLATLVYSDTTNQTNGRCISTCAAAGWTFSGTQYSQECWCGNAIPIQLDPDSNCNFGCTGNVGQTCGGDGILHDTPHISLFADSTKFNGNTTSAPLQITPNVGLYSFLGCYADVSGKTLSTKQTSSNIMTVEACQVFCAAYTYFGLEYGAECYCGNTLSTASTVQNSSQCSMPCKGSNSEFCGAGSRMQIYQANGALPGSSSSSGVSSTSSLSTSSTLTVSSSSSTASMSSSSVSSSVTVSSTSSASSAPVSSSSSTSNSSGTSTPSVTLVSSSSTSSSTTPTSTGLPTTVPSTTAFTYVGCYNDIPGRALTSNFLSNTSITVDLCASFCSSYTFFGVEYGQECYCGSGIPLSSIPTTDGRCSYPCIGNPSQICGGFNGLSLYQATSSATGNPANVSGYKSLGCYAEKPNSRALSNVYRNDSMTNALCAAQAAKSGYAYFGTEYKRECWMGNVLDSATPAASTNCALLCAGNQFETCGGLNFLNLYSLGSVGATSSSASMSSTSSAAGLLSSTSLTSTSLISSSSTSSSATSTSTTSSSSTSIASTSAVSTSLTAISTSSTSILSSSTSGSVAPSPTGAVGCPSWNSSTYSTTGGASYRIECSFDRLGNDLTWNYTNSFSSCLASCDKTLACKGVSWVAVLVGSGPCYLKSALGSAINVNTGIWGAVQLSSSLPSSSSSVSSLSTSSSVLSPTSAVTSSSRPTSSSSALVSSTISPNILSFSSSSSSTTLSTSTPLATSSSSAISTTSTSSSSSSSTASPNTSSLSSVVTSTSVATTSSSPPISSSMVLASGTTTYPPTPSRTAVSCPGMNQTVYTSPAGGQYLIECGIDRPGGDLSPQATLVTNLEACIALCDSSSGCVDVSFSGGACYPKGTIGGPTPNTQVWGARLLVPAPVIASRPAVNSYAYIGCWAEAVAPAISGRAINALGVYKNTTSMTPALCATYCTQYAYFGVEYGSECWCGPYLNSNTSMAAKQADCNMACPGDSTQICGGPSRLSLYRSTDPSKVSSDPAVPGPKIGNYTYAYCSIDSASGVRLLSTSIVSDSMSTKTCLAAAEAGQYAFAGLEYGRECWMGNALAGNSTVTGNVRTAEGDCKLSCVGARGELCGGISRMNLWVRSTGGG